jgi:hypothetical protein
MKYLATLRQIHFLSPILSPKNAPDHHFRTLPGSEYTHVMGFCDLGRVGPDQIHDKQPGMDEQVVYSNG